MEHEWVLYIAIFATSFALSLLATPYAKTISLKLGAVDYPKKRGMHDVPLPRMGGVAIYFGFMVSMLIFTPFINEFQTKQFFGFIIGATIIFILGVVDDMKELKAKHKLFFQIIACLVVVFSGTTIGNIKWPVNIDLRMSEIPITVVWIIVVTNAFNLIDGLDGLAAGVSTIGAICLTILCVLTGSPLAVVLSAALAGSCLGFLPRNFNPAEVIMGDSGSTFLGFVLAVSSIIGLFKAYAIINIAIALLALALPIFDVCFSIIRRFLQGKPIMQADRGHIHHRLIDYGFSHKQAVIIIYVLSIFTGAISIALAMKQVFFVVLIIVIAGVILLMSHVYKKRILEKDKGL